MSRNRHGLRGAHGRFVAAGEPGTELKRGRGSGVRGPQVRQKHKGALTPAEIENFLHFLAETCNVALSARETKRSARVFYDLRRRDPGFRAAWAEALREGYERLDMELVERCRFGAPKDIFYQGRKTATTRVFNDATALRLLHLHRKSIEQMRAVDERRAPDAKAIFDQLAARVAEIRAEAAKRSGEGGDEEA
ncbi:MAG: hypothetical protein QOJ91_493 [Sphingomonadales bacterium]|nr:hypothetical protein [Sphingomonadales bacterium]